MLIKAITSAGAEASEAVMVGDSRNDALAARAAGIRAMLVESGYNEGVPLKEWARTAGFNEVFPSVKEVCEELLAQQGSRKCGD
jgi:phosphoglycolate phosphatase